MRAIPIIVTVISVIASAGIAGAAQPAEDVVSYTRKAILETEEGPITKEINEAGLDRRKELLAAVVQITDEAFKTPEPKSGAVRSLIVTCAHILEAVADDDATIAAFASRLDEVYNASRPAVIRALARCRDPRAVDALAEYARARLKDVSAQPLEFPPTWTEEQRQTSGREIVNFRFALSGLAHSANPSGKAVARELRDKYVKLYDGSHLRDGVLRGLEELEIDPLLRGTTQPEIPPGRTPAAASSGLPKQTPPSRSAKSEPVPQSSRMQGTSKIGTAVAAVIGSLIILGFFIWFLRKK